MRLLPLVILLALLGACAKPFQSDYAGRFSSTQLDSNVFRISYRGNTTPTAEEVRGFALLKSAEISLEHGFNYFVIVETVGPSSKDNGTGADFGQADNAQETTGYEPTSSAGQTYVHANPGVTNTIVGFKEKPQGFAYVALFLKATLRNKYRLDKVAE